VGVPGVVVTRDHGLERGGGVVLAHRGKYSPDEAPVGDANG
jgi:hypothetical protein